MIPHGSSSSTPSTNGTNSFNFSTNPLQIYPGLFMEHCNAHSVHKTNEIKCILYLLDGGDGQRTGCGWDRSRGRKIQCPKINPICELIPFNGIRLKCTCIYPFPLAPLQLLLFLLLNDESPAGLTGLKPKHTHLTECSVMPWREVLLRTYVFSNC